MEQLFQLIGSIASIGSIPLAIYLYLKSKDAKYDRVRREIVKTISYQIGEKRILSTFEISTVIKSKLRESKLKHGIITDSSIIEDLVSETISSPLLEKERKEKIITNLKDIYLRGNILQLTKGIENIKLEDIESILFYPRTQTEISNVKKIPNEISSELKQNYEIHQKELKKIENRRRKYNYFTTLFGLISVITTFIIGFITSFQKNDLVFILDKLNFKSNELVIVLLAGLIASLTAGLFSSLINKIKKDEDED